MPAALEPANRMSLAGRHQPPAFVWAVCNEAFTCWPLRYTKGRPPDSRIAIVFDRPSVTSWKLTPAAFVAGLDDTASGAVPAASRGVSPVGATPFPLKRHADCPPTLS